MRFTTIILGLAVLLVSASGLFAEEEMHHDHDHAQHMHHDMGPAMDHQDDQSVPAVEVGNKTCPVSGEKVGEMGEVVKYEYNGKIYNLCCEACMKDFRKDPEKYSKIAEEEVKAQAAEEMSDLEKMGHAHKASHENHPGHDHSDYKYDRGY